MKSLACTLIYLCGTGSAFAFLADLKRSEETELALPKVSSEIYPFVSAPTSRRPVSVSSRQPQPPAPRAERTITVSGPWDFRFPQKDSDARSAKTVTLNSGGTWVDKNTIEEDLMAGEGTLRYGEVTVFERHERIRRRIWDASQGKRFTGQYIERHAFVLPGKEGESGKIAVSFFSDSEGSDFLPKFNFLSRHNKDEIVLFNPGFIAEKEYTHTDILFF